MFRCLLTDQFSSRRLPLECGRPLPRSPEDFEVEVGIDNLLQYPLHDGIRRLVQHLNFLYKSEPAFSEDDDSYAGFEWIDLHDADNSIFTFVRKGRSGSTLLFAVNATPVPRHAYRVGAPGEGWYQEILNTDAGIYGGGNIGNWGGMHADSIHWQGRSHSLCLTLPPLSTIGFKRHEYK
jgi:1,4-alpha-glucan branching enzyme